jgi:hypothetical protein
MPEGFGQAKKLYGRHYAMCHGENGDGKGDLAVQMKLALHDWTDTTALAKFTDGELFLHHYQRPRENDRWGGRSQQRRSTLESGQRGVLIRQAARSCRGKVVIALSQPGGVTSVVLAQWCTVSLGQSML